MGRLRSVYGAPLGRVEAIAHWDGRLGLKESSPKFRLLALKSLAQRLLLVVPNPRQLIPHCLPRKQATVAPGPSRSPVKWLHQLLEEGGGQAAEPSHRSAVALQMANDSTETSEAGEEEEDHEGDSENKERMPFIQ